MSSITLTSDYGTKDHFISSVKGFIYANSKSVNIVDISHEIDPFNIGQCAYIFRNSYPNFADNTNSTADPTAEFPREIYSIDRKSGENRETVEFELAAPTDLAGVRIPKRQCTRRDFPGIGTFTQ